MTNLLNPGQGLRKHNYLFTDYFFENMSYVPLLNVTSTQTWSRHIVTFSDYPGQATYEQCSKDCFVTIPNCMFFVVDGTRCHFGEYPSEPLNYTPHAGSSGTFDLHLAQGMYNKNTSLRQFFK